MGVWGGGERERERESFFNLQRGNGNPVRLRESGGRGGFFNIKLSTNGYSRGQKSHKFKKEAGRGLLLNQVFTKGDSNLITLKRASSASR